MMLSSSQKQLIKDTIPVLRENGAALTDYFYNRMLSNNPGLRETFNMGNQRSGAQAKALAGAVLAYAENIDNPDVLLPVIELICNKHVSLNIQAADYDIVGENLLISISEVLNLPMDCDLIAAWGAAYGQLADIFIQTERGMYSQQEALAGGWLGWRDFTVIKKVPESDEITSFYLKPVDGGIIPSYKPGQYVSVRVHVPQLGFRQPRQYSISDSPGNEYIRITVKHESSRSEDQDPGYVSTTLHEVIQIGNVIELSAGVGLTPMVAMLNQIITSETGAPVFFIHAVRGAQYHALKNEIAELNKNSPNLHVFYIYESVGEHDIPGSDYHMQGRLDIEMLPENYLPSDADFYLCGPQVFMQQQHKALIKKGINPDKIFSEAFGTGGVSL